MYGVQEHRLTCHRTKNHSCLSTLKTPLNLVSRKYLALSTDLRGGWLFGTMLLIGHLRHTV